MRYNGGCHPFIYPIPPIVFISHRPACRYYPASVRVDFRSDRIGVTKLVYLDVHVGRILSIHVLVTSAMLETLPAPRPIIHLIIRRPTFFLSASLR